MDILRFSGGVDGDDTGYAEIVPDISSVTWIERYREASEFTIKGKLSSGLRLGLQAGQMVSHTESDVVMIVENHEISIPDGGEEPEIVVTGRSFEAAALEQRVVGADIAEADYAVDNTLLGTVLASDYVWNQAKALIEQCIKVDGLVDHGNAIANTVVWIQDGIIDQIAASGYTSEAVARQVSIGSLYSAVMELLKLNDLGFTATWRPWSVYETRRLKIYIGHDLSRTLVFSHTFDDIDTPDYLWSLKPYKNAAIVVGRWVSVSEPGVQSGLNRRWMTIDGSDIDQAFSEPPTGGYLVDVTTAMRNRARDAIAAQRPTAVAQVKPKPVAKRYLYRRDYNLGDIVTLQNDFDKDTAQIIEHVEIEDETGFTAYPTFGPGKAEGAPL